jgi:hypothetical protein
VFSSRERKKEKASSSNPHRLRKGFGRQQGEGKMKSSSSSSFPDSKFLHADVPVQVPSAYTGCRSIERFEKLNNIAEGAYGIVYRARDSETGDIVAIKRVKLEESDELGGFPITSLREVNISLTLRHQNLIASKEMVVGGRGDSGE